MSKLDDTIEIIVRLNSMGRASMQSIYLPPLRSLQLQEGGLTLLAKAEQTVVLQGKRVGLPPGVHVCVLCSHRSKQAAHLSWEHFGSGPDVQLLQREGT